MKLPQNMFTPTNTGLHPSNTNRRSRTLRGGGFSPTRRSQCAPLGVEKTSSIEETANAPEHTTAQDDDHPLPCSPPCEKRRRRRPSTACGSSTPALASSVPSLPLSSRVPGHHTPRLDNDWGKSGGRWKGVLSPRKEAAGIAIDGVAGGSSSLTTPEVRCTR